MISLTVVEPSQIGAARRRAVQEGEAVGLSRDACDRLAIVVTEAATNLVRHAQMGEIVLIPCRNRRKPGLTVLALDSGPGIGNVEAALADGYTTATAGEQGIGGGLGAIDRLSDGFDIHSDPRGTTVLARFGPECQPPHVETAGLIVPKPGYASGGDAYAVRTEPSATLVMLMDVLGHGPTAAEDAAKGIAAFEAAMGAMLAETEARVAAALEGGRGAAALIVEIPHGPGILKAAGLGNVRGEIAGPGGQRHGIPSTPGIIGASPRRPRLTEHEWPAGVTLILSTDGLRGAERTPDPVSLFARHPLTIAATLYKRRRRGTDDSGVVIARGRM